MSTSVDVSAAAGRDEASEYERPVLVPVGNLHDLLLGASGTQCDALTTINDIQVATGTNCL
jgi:hypothetical protein